MSKLKFVLKQEVEGAIYTDDHGDTKVYVEDCGGFELVYEGYVIDSYCKSGFTEYFDMLEQQSGEMLLSELETTIKKHSLVVTDRRPNVDGDEYLELVPEFSEYDGDESFSQFVTDPEVYEDGGGSGWDDSMDERMRDAFPKAKRLFVYVEEA